MVSFAKIVGTVLRRRQWHPTLVLLPGKSRGRRSLVGCSPWCHSSLTRLRLHFHFSLSCTGEGNGNPLQCSCLENPRDGEAWWATVYGVAQSRTQLKRLSSSSCSRHKLSHIQNGWRALTFSCLLLKILTCLVLESNSESKRLAINVIWCMV